MKRIAWILLGAVVLVGVAQAAYVEMNAPGTISVGQTLQVSGDSLGTLTPGFSTQLIFYRVDSTKTAVNETMIVVQQGGVFSASFITSGLQAGQYVLELVDPTGDTFGGSAKTLLFVTLIDRQNEITITSPLTQPFNGYLSIQGSISTALNNGTQIRVDHNGATIFGPIYLGTNNGAFSTDVNPGPISITEGGNYTAYFSDSKSYIGSAQFTVLQPVQTTAATTTATPAPPVSASAQASRDQPAYFAVKTLPGMVTLSTSSGIDWVMEYINEDNQLTVVHGGGTLSGETATFQAMGGTVYAEIYPFLFSDQGTVTLTATNAASVAPCTSCVALFTTTPPPTTTQKSPVPSFLAIVALIVTAFLAIARRR